VEVTETLIISAVANRLLSKLFGSKSRLLQTSRFPALAG